MEQLARLEVVVMALSVTHSIELLIFVQRIENGEQLKVVHKLGHIRSYDVRRLIYIACCSTV